MEQLTIRKAGIEDIDTIQLLANDIWPKVYDYMISQTQIQYMLNVNYSLESLTRQIVEHEHIFFIAEWNEVPIGFASVGKLEEDIFKLHKLYVQPEQHGKGAGIALVKAVIKKVTETGGKRIRLNVNKYNKSVAFYRNFGFSIIEELVLDIGAGYVMDDYIMEFVIP